MVLWLIVLFWYWEFILGLVAIDRYPLGRLEV